MAINPQHQSLLCTLIPELRNRIWHLVFTADAEDNGKVILSSRKGLMGPIFGEEHSLLRLLETCRLIRNEAEAIFYDINEFELQGLAGLEDLESALAKSPARKDGVWSLTVHLMYFDCVEKAGEIAMLFPRLERLSIWKIHGPFDVGRRSYADLDVAALRSGRRVTEVINDVTWVRTWEEN